MRCVVLVLLLAVFLRPDNAVNAAEWIRTYGGSKWTIVHPAPDGGFILGGTVDRGAPTWQDVWIERIDADGNPLWTKIFAATDGGVWDDLNALRPTIDGGVIAVGSTDASTATSAWIMKLDGRGNIVWQSLFGDLREGGESASDVVATADGAYVVAGTGQFEGGQFGWVLKLDDGGHILWDRTYGGPEAWLLKGIEPAADGGYIVAGYMSPLVTDDFADAWVMKLDAVGNVVWQKSFGGDSDDAALEVRSVATGGYVAAGGAVLPGQGWRPWVVRLDESGTIVWERTFDRPYANVSVQPVGDGGFVVADSSGVVWKLDADGNVGWQRFYGGGTLTGRLRRTDDGGFVMGGLSLIPVDAHVLKLDADGAVQGCVLMAPYHVTAVPRQSHAAETRAAVGTSGVTLRSATFEASEGGRSTRQQCLHVPPGGLMSAVEYYQAWFDHYFITATPAEIVALDEGSFSAYGGWARTGEWFTVYPLGAAEATVCRFFSGQSYAPMSTHFYTGFAEECEAVKRDPHWTFEGEVFALAPPFLSVACREGTTPLYRLYNGSIGGAPNHRYTTSGEVRADMLARGWVAEGPGAGIAGCVPVR